MTFIKLHSADVDRSVVRVNVDKIVAYLAPKENIAVTVVQFGFGQSLPVTESPEEIDALIEGAKQ